MDPKYNLSVAIIAIFAFAVSSFSLGQVMGMNNSIQALSRITQPSTMSEASVLAGMRRLIGLNTSPSNPGPVYVCTYPGGATLTTTSPGAVTSFTYNNGTNTYSVSGAEIQATCVVKK